MAEKPKLIDLNGLGYYNEYISGRLDSYGYRISDLEDDKAAVFQLYEMPEASEEYSYMIYQYVGETDQDFTNGYFYKVETTYTQGEPSYSWVQVNVQPASSSGGGVIGDNTNGRSSSVPATFDIYNAEPGVYAPAYLPMYVRMSQYEVSGTNLDLQVFDNITVFKKYSDASANDKLAYTVIYNQYSSSRYVGVYITKNSSGNGINWTSATDVNNMQPYYAWTSVPTYISTDWSFQYAPQTSNAPLYASSITNKEYVDTSLLKSLGINAFSTTTSYSVGDYVYRQSGANFNIYKCNTATSGSWVAANWTQKTLLDYLNDKLVGTALNASY